MVIYNLFPRLVGPCTWWGEHFQRAAVMGFDWLFLNPIQLPGCSGSLYSIKDYWQFNPLFLDPADGRAPVEQVRRMIGAAHDAGLKVMIDLVVNHCASDSPLTHQHPEWFAREDGRLAHPYCVDGKKKVVWRDVVCFDHTHSGDPEGLYRYCRGVAEYLMGLGFDGFRCDAAYQLPTAFWRRLIEEIHSLNGDVRMVAETLGCTADQTKEMAATGFKYLFNSAKWWDFQEPWLIEQYGMTRDIAASISFPESHDTERLCAELNGNVAGLKQRYLFTALFSTGVMIPVGFEFGFRKRLDVMHTSPADWETTSLDLRPFITAVNAVKKEHPAFHEECPAAILPCPNPNILLLWKAATGGRCEALIILNKDIHSHQEFAADHFRHYVQSGAPLRDVSPEHPLEYVPEPFHYALRPGQGIVLVTARD